MGFLGMFHAAEFVSPGLATVIANAQPIIAAVLAHIFLGEHLKATGTIGLWFEVLERVSLIRANAFTFLVPIFGLMIGAAFFSERLEAVHIVSVVLVLSGILLVQRSAASS